jgi:hypothetical protein
MPLALFFRLKKLRGWRIRFFAGYLLALARYRSIASILLSLTEDSFACPWVSRVTLEFLAFPPPPCDEYPIPIDAPVVLTVWHKNKKALVMSGHF